MRTAPEARALIAEIKTEEETRFLRQIAREVRDLPAHDAQREHRSEATRQFQKQLAARIRTEVLYQQPATVNFEFGPRVSRSLQGRWQSAKDAFARMMGPGSDIDGQVITINQTRAGRSYYQNQKIYLTSDVSLEVIIHELGHWLETKAPRVRAAVHEFFDRRTSGETLQSLRDLTGYAYSQNERTYVDDFLDPYMGKNYVGRYGVRYGTEILSMGLQYLYDDPALLADRDSDMFDFLYTLLREEL